MKELRKPAALVALDRALAAGGVCALDPAVPAALWRRALAGPAAEFLARPGKALRTTIVRTGWLLGGGAPDALPAQLPLVIELLHAGSLIIDDVEDGARERRGAPALHELVGTPLAINTGSWLYFWALAELAETVPAAMPRAVATLARCHLGQALDLATRIGDLAPRDVPAVVATITRHKTGALCRLAAELGAIAAGGDACSSGEFAEHMGCALQMLDDLGSLTARRDKGQEDLREGRATWPWAWLAELAPDELAQLAPRSPEVDPDALFARVEALGRARIRATLDEALAALPDHPIKDTIAGELRRMETSYG